MINPHSDTRRAAAGWRLLALCLTFLPALAFGQTATTVNPEGAKKSYSLPAGDAAATLKQFVEQSGEQIVYVVDSVRGVQTKAVSGQFSAREALDQMLAGTSLVAVKDNGSAALTVRRESDVEKNADSRLARGPAAKIEDGVVKMQEFEVTGRKIDGLINKGLIPTSENQPVYHETITRVEIERLGVTSFEELFRYIPQTTSGENGFQAAVNNVNVSGGTVANISRVGLRGFQQSQTTILINGRIQPRAGTGLTSGTDLSRIPIAAIDKIEILPMSGSAMYGGGAIGGAINVILRREYAAKELTTYVGTSTDGGATEYRLSYFDGRTFDFFGRKSNLTMLVDYRHRDALKQRDRNYLARAYAKYGPNTTERNAAGVSAFELFTLRALAGSRPVLLTANAPTAAVNDLGVPGAPGLRWVQIPSGTSPAASEALTPASFTANAGQFTPGDRFLDQSIYNPEDNYSVNLQFEHELPAGLKLYSEAGYIYSRAKYSYPQFLSASLTATDPLNPFRTNVTPGFVGRAVTVLFDSSDVEDPSSFEERETARFVLGVKGKVGANWEWSLDGSYDYNHTFTASNNTVNLLPTVLTSAAGLTGTDPVTGQPRVAAPLATRRQIYPLLADHSAFPVPVSDSDRYWFSYRNSGSFTNNFIGIARVNGTVWELPSGPVNVSVLGDYTTFDRKGGQRFVNSDDIYTLISGFPFRDTPSGNPNHRTTIGTATELVLPVFNEKWRPRFVPFKSLDLNFSARREVADSDFISPSNGAFAENSKTGKAYVSAAKLQFSQDLAVRYSRTDGLYVPDWNDFGDPRNTFLNFLNAPDPFRGNTSQPTGTYNVLNGGNPDLKSETAISENFGVILSPRWVKGLTVNLDFWRIEKENGISLIQAPQLIILSNDFPSRVTRAPLTPADQALGYTAGLVTFVDQTRINVARIETQGIDTQIDYNFEVSRLGRFRAMANASFTDYFKTQNVPGGVYTNTAAVSGPRRWRGRMALTWMGERWEATLSGRYSGHYSTSTTAPTPALPTAFPFDGGRIPAHMRYDLQVSYSVPASADDGWRRWLQGTKFTLGCQNVLNDEPAMISDGTGFYDRQDDPRQRYVYVSIKKRL